jgi:hypothetical protein
MDHMTAQIDRFSLVTAPVALYFDDTHLSDATGFVWQQGRHSYLITNWHVVTGRNALDGQSLHSHGGRPTSARNEADRRIAGVQLMLMGRSCAYGRASYRSGTICISQSLSIHGAQVWEPLR